MLIDRSTKIILLLIASGLWVNAIGSALKTSPAHAADSDVWLMSIDSNIAKLARGTCTNGKLC